MKQLLHCLYLLPRRHQYESNMHTPHKHSIDNKSFKKSFFLGRVVKGLSAKPEISQ